MITDIDQVLRRLLIRELPIKNGEVEIKFDQPSREWSSRLSRPTLNLFLHDIRENQKLRQSQPAWEIERNNDGSITKRRRPVRVDLHYMITAWANDPEDEHNLLSRTLVALFRFPNLPEDLLTERLRQQPGPLPIMAAQYDELRTPTDIWNVLDNEIRPAIACTVTVAIDPYQPAITPLVRTRELRVGPVAEPSRQRLEAHTVPDQLWTVGGWVRGDRSWEPDQIRLRLLERDKDIPVQPDGRFVIGALEAGTYTLELLAADRPARRYPITVPAADYTLEI